MKSLFAIILLLVVACQTRNNNPSDISAIHRWINNYESAIRTADIEALLSGESDVIVYFPPNQPAFSGKENLRKWFLDYFNYYEASELLLARDIKVKGDIAYLSCNYVVSVKVKYSGEKFKDTGKLINIFKREPYGNWRCIYSIWNSNYRSLDLHTQIPADFSGVWDLDLTRSTPAPNIISSKIVITQKGNNINIDRSYEIQGKEPLKSNLNCTIGREIKSNSKSESFITDSFWSNDKQSFTIIEKLISMTGKEYKRTTVYSLTAKGENLKIISFDQFPERLLFPQRQIEMTYNKLMTLQ